VDSVFKITPLDSPVLQGYKDKAIKELNEFFAEVRSMRVLSPCGFEERGLVQYDDLAKLKIVCLF